jgi:thiol:disulfide interchange protein DsbD
MHAHPRLISEFQSLVAGRVCPIAITFDIDPKWHLYWKGQNDAGMPVEMTFDLPAGFSVGTPAWPAPTREVLAGDIVNYIFHNRLTVILPLTVPADAAGKTTDINAKLRWLVCEERCVLEDASVRLKIPVIASPADKPVPELKPGPDQTRFEEARRRWPTPPEASAKIVKAAFTGTKVVLAVEGASRLVFFPDEGGVTILNAASTGAADQSALTLEYEQPAAAPTSPGTGTEDPSGTADSAHATANPGVLWGVLEVTRVPSEIANPQTGSTPQKDQRRSVLEWYEVRIPLNKRGVDR